MLTALVWVALGIKGMNWRNADSFSPYIIKMLRFALILTCSLAIQAVPVPSTATTKSCEDYTHKVVDVVNFISRNDAVELNKNSKINFQATKLFPCGLPSTFTLAISYNSTGKNRKDRCLFYLDSPAEGMEAALALCFEPENQRMRLEYQDGSENPFHTLHFDAPADIFNLNQNHTIITTVTINSVTMTFDCITTKTVHLGRTEASAVSSKGLLYIGGMTSPSFVGVIDQFEITPYSSDNIKHYCGAMELQERPLCDRTNEGLLWYNYTANVLYKCEKSVWTIPKNDHQSSDSNECSKKLNYLELFQDLGPSVKSSYIKPFEISGVGSFLVVATHQDTDSNNAPVNSPIYKWGKTRWMFYQNIETFEAQAIDFIVATGTPLLIVANMAGRRSSVYHWNYATKKFQLHQNIPSSQARDVDAFDIAGEQYVVVANHARPSGGSAEFNINSVIYKWTQNKFVEYQQIPTKGAIDVEHFKIQQYNLLAVANVFDGTTTEVDSVIYYLDPNTKLFRSLQNIPTFGATDWEYLEINGDHYIVVANTVKARRQTATPTPAARVPNLHSNDDDEVHSVIYKLDISTIQFKPYQEIATANASDWQTFTVGCNHYLIVSNSNPRGNDKETTSVVYQYQGLEQFVPVHSIKMKGAVSWEHYTQDNEQYLTCASSVQGDSKVIKLIT